ncbi:hypothetical protein NHQ30_001379 [Ciborinia camelliae]|nr:hypothetical protein NHQ30_001379 [Ciborinia camelliae]
MGSHGDFHASTGITPPKGPVSYGTYKSPYGPKYKIQPNIAGWTPKAASKVGLTLAGFGASAGFFALFFFSDIPRVRNDIMVKIPIIGDRWRREIPASDNTTFPQQTQQSTALSCDKAEINTHFNRNSKNKDYFPRKQTPPLSVCRSLLSQNLKVIVGPVTAEQSSGTMAGSDLPHDPQKALEFKKRGNDHFQSGNYEAAEQFYSKAISLDPSNPILHTNHSKALLKLTRYAEAIASSESAIRVTSASPINSVSMKAYYNIAQAQHAQREYDKALQAVERAREFCIRDMPVGGKGLLGSAKSLPSILDLGLRCRKEGWEEREERRRRERAGLVGDVVALMRREGRRGVGDRVRRLGHDDDDDVGGVVGGNTDEKATEEWEKKIEEVERVFRLVETQGKEGRRREMPDWAIDGISFNVMIDPVMTKTGQSYERSSILQHLERSSTDPLTREPLLPGDLRPNLGLKHAVEEFLEENGWAVEW